MKKILLILVLSSFFFSSCDIVRLLTSGDIVKLLSIKEKKNDTKDQAAQFLNDKYKYDYSFFLIDSMYYQLTDSAHKINKYADRVSAIQVRIYDNKGNLYTGFTQCLGDFENKHFLGRTYPPTINIKDNLNEKLKLSSEFEIWEITQNEINEINLKLKETDYVIVAYWSIWTNGFSKEVLREVTKYTKKYKDKNLLVIYVNIAIDI